MVTVCLAANLATPGYIEKTTFDAAFALTGAQPLAYRKAWFITLMDLTETTIVPCIDCPPIDAYAFGVFWLLMAAFAIDPGLSCPDGCPIREFSA